MANMWVYIGMFVYDNHHTGWVWLMMDKGIQHNEFMPLYITSFYFVITTFSSVGYGDVVGLTKEEYIFQMFVEMVGIGFFGYMVGSFQNLI